MTSTSTIATVHKTLITLKPTLLRSNERRTKLPAAYTRAGVLAVSFLAKPTLSVELGQFGAKAVKNTKRHVSKPRKPEKLNNNV